MKTGLYLSIELIDGENDGLRMILKTPCFDDKANQVQSLRLKMSAVEAKLLAASILAMLSVDLKTKKEKQ